MIPWNSQDIPRLMERLSVTRGSIKCVLINRGTLVYTKTMTSDEVVMRSTPMAIEKSTKLQCKYKGPFVVVDISPSNKYHILKRLSDNRQTEVINFFESADKQWTRKNSIGTVNKSLLFKCKSRSCFYGAAMCFYEILKRGREGNQQHCKKGTIKYKYIETG